MRTLLIAIACCTPITLAAFAGDNLGKEEPGISELIVEYGSLVRQVGLSHPSTQLMRRKIDYCISDGENKLDAHALSNKLDEYYHKFRELRDQVGLTHPSTQTVLNKIAIASRLMLANEVVTNGNLEGLLKDSCGIDDSDNESRRTTE